MEAHAVRNTSRRGAAALGRRALQNALRDRGFKAKKLYDEIELAEKDPRATPSLVEKLHFIREVGNDGAHPNIDAVGQIIDVTEDELDLLLAALDEFFDLFYVRPAKHTAVMQTRAARLSKPPEGAK
jgi:hypothetical protein